MPHTHRLFLAAGLLAAAACGDRGITTPPATPQPKKPTSGLLSKAPVTTTEAVQVLLRSKPLPQDFSTSNIIGPAGGVLSIPAAGVHVIFARGAVSAPTRITMTAIAGAAVAYEFQPHGLTFNAPVTVVQDLKQTAAEHDASLRDALQGSYFDTDLPNTFVDAAHNFARIRESRHGKLKKDARFLEFIIEHFSGYMVSTGLVSVDIEIGIR